MSNVDSNTVLRLINNIASVSSKNEKQVMVSNAMSSELFAKVCEYAYNPFKTYGIKKMPERESIGVDDCFDENTWKILDDLIDRKLTGNDARSIVSSEIARLSEQSADLFIRIIRKDLRAGFSESTINKTKKGLIPEFPYMRCCLPKDAKIDKFDWEFGVISQEKADGMFANVNNEPVESGGVSITSRQGTPFPMEEFEALAKVISETFEINSQTHGEIVVVRDGNTLPREIGNGILNSVLQGGKFDDGDKPVFLAWDQIPLSCVVPKGKCETPYKIRFGYLMRQIKLATETGVNAGSVLTIPTKIVHSYAGAILHYRDLLQLGKEGTVFKDPNAIWKDGTSKHQVKLKLEADVDLKVVAIVPGKEGGKNEGRAGSLQCVTSDGLLCVDVTVKNEAMRDRVDAANDDWIGRIITVRANAILEPSESNPLNSLFLPRMVEPDYRSDKTEADSLQRVRDQFESAMKAA